MSRPVLIYVSKEDCGACKHFTETGQWEMVKSTIGDSKAIFVKFHIDPKNGKVLPPVLTSENYFYPMIILANANSYYQFFTPQDQVNTATWNDKNKIVGLRYAAVEEKGKFIHSGRQIEAKGIIEWFKQKSSQMSGPLNPVSTGIPASGPSYFSGPYSGSDYSLPAASAPTPAKKTVRFDLPES